MSQQEHRLGVSEVNLVTRHLKLDPVENSLLELAISDIDQLYGVDGVSFDEESHVLNIAYDASRVNIDDVENILTQHQVIISHGWWTRFKEGYYRFVDENVKDNSTHEPWSCHKVPPSTRRKR